MSKKNGILFLSLFYFSTLVFSQQVTDTINKTDKSGKKQGFWKKKDEKGILKYEGSFLDNYPIGEFKYYYEDGQTKAISKFFEKGLRSNTTTYYPNGNLMSEGYYISTHKDSTWKYYNINRVLIREESYRATLKNGEWKTYYDDGTLTDRINWKNGKREGIWEQNYSGGTLKTQFKNDKLEGIYQVFTPEGKLRNQGKYKNNLKDGIWFWYDEKGLPNKKFVYKDNKLLGKYIVLYDTKKPVEISFDSIAYVYTNSGITYIKTVENLLLQTNTKFSEVVNLLDIDNFLLINKNFLANLGSLKGIESYSSNMYKVQLSIQPEFEVIAEGESVIALKTMFQNFK
ncbi:MAG: LytTR family transcriptional regulator DNA-binding domain-containing protein [Bacteroidetes bacterium]|nr:LytTR family transcriptional regulator DNA-binding domain-containing protein [Bacteroidota bacterium]